MFNNFNIGKILTGFNKALTVAGKALPLIEEAKPIVSNAKSLLAGKFGSTNKNEKTEEKVIKTEVSEDNSPTFFQ